MTQNAHTQSTISETPEHSLRLYNTLSHQIEHLIPLEAGHCRIYSCGPTVYRFIHIGNLRTFAMADWLKRTLLYNGLRVTHIKNITDVGHMRQERLDQGEDKIVSQARHEGKSPWEIAQFYIDAFQQDETLFHILPADVFPRATEHISDMIAIIQQLLDKGFAYEVEGNIFFAVKTYPSYGMLSGNILENMGQGLHIGNELDTRKRAPEDFPLWKTAEQGRIMAWDSPWGRGFPGWHIECSAMSRRYLGASFDIHTGGVDNIFPHHEDERAQSEASSGQQFVQYWMHGQHLLADGLKMAKSSGNAYTLSDIIARGFDPLALRYLFATVHYRHIINFTFKSLTAAQTAYHRLQYTIADLTRRMETPHNQSIDIAHHPQRLAFYQAINNDLNLPRAIAILWAVVGNKSLAAGEKLALLFDFDQVLGLDLAAATERVAIRESYTPPADIAAQMVQRTYARQLFQFDNADAIRVAICSKGFAVRDTATGTIIVPDTARVNMISTARDIPSQLTKPAVHTFSINLIAHNNHDDLQRCLHSIVHHAGTQDIEIIIIDNGSTDETLDLLHRLQREQHINGIPVATIFADHDMGFAAGRNATFRASLGKYIIVLDTSIEINGDIWSPILATLHNPTIGLTGPYGLVTEDLKEFTDSNGPDVDAIEGYLMAFPRAALLEVGPADEKFRFYRLMDIDYSFEFKKAGYRVAANSTIAERIIKHPHREWYQLTVEEQAGKSKKNFDIFRRKRHHCQSLLAGNYIQGQIAPWGHDHIVESPDPHFEHGHIADDVEHIHEHKHWPDHSHTHAHRHVAAAKWFVDE